MQLSFFDVPPVDVPAEIKQIVSVPNDNSSDAKHGHGPSVDLDYQIDEADPIGFGGQMAKVRQNLAAIRLLRQLQEEGRQATPEEQKLLVLYTGWGHTAQPFHPQPKGKWAELQAEMRPYFTSDQWRAAAASTINAHYTSPIVIRWIWRVVERLGFTGGKILEPAAGVGHFLGLMPEAIRIKSKLWACELDLISGAIVKQLYPSVRVLVDGFENAPYENDFFDLVISNVPFSEVAVTDPVTFQNGRGHLADTGLHNYFFIKALDIVRPGGLIVFITSRFTLDSLETKVRAYLADLAHLVGAVRLPVTAFKKNAHTEVTTDVIFLLKKDPALRFTGQRDCQVHSADWVETISKGEYRLNEFYEAYPEMMLGQMQQTGGRYKDAYECVATADNLPEALARVLTLPVLPRGIYLPAESRRRLARIEPETLENPPAEPWLREGSYYMDDHYRVWHAKRNGSWQRANLEGKQLSRVRGLIEVRDAFLRVIGANARYAPDELLDQVQQELAGVYRRFVNRWGFLHEAANIAAFSEDPDADSLLALERWDPDAGVAEKAAIFSQRLVRPESRPAAAETAMEALAISLRETGQVDWARMIELTGKSQAELVEELDDRVYQVYDASDEVARRGQSPKGDREHPNFKTRQLVWITADEYLSGNVRAKLAEARQWAAEDPALERNVLALEAVLPRDAEPREIFAQLGAPWIPQDVIQDFIHHRLFREPFNDSYDSRVEVRYVHHLGYWRLDTLHAGRMLFSRENKKTWGTHRIDGFSLIEKCLNGQMAAIYDTIIDEFGNEKKKLNHEATLVARAKQAEIRAAFEGWLWTDERRAARLARIYNDRFNSYIARRYDGSHLTFPGLNPAISLRHIQQDVIWRGLQNKSLMIAHQVGFGKTLSQIGLSQRLKQMGLRQRIMIVVKRSTFGQFTAAFREAYPLAHISPIASGQTPHQRRRQLARIVTEDFEAIITTHPIFSKIPLKPQTKIRFLQEQLAELQQAILEVKGDRISTKELEKAKKRLENKIKKQMEKGMARDPNALYYEDLGIDALIVDEANSFKNLWFFTVGSRISGISGTESGRAFDMFLKIRLLQERAGFVAFATGTPLENSISEVYTMMRFLIPDILEEMGLHHFDAWRATFGRVVAAVEMKPDGSGFRVNNRFAAFNNLPQLKQLWWQVADVRMNAEEAGIELPDLAGGRAIGIQAQPYPELKQIIQTLANRANNLGDVDPSIDNILKIISDADKASLDARLLGRFPVVDDQGDKTGEFIEITEDYAGSKVNLCADKVAEIYQATTGIEIPGVEGRHNLTQLIFLDASTPKAGQWTVYEDLKQKLIARGVKAEEIAFAQDYSSDDKKARLAAAIDAGRIRVAIGSTEVMGIGLNCQRLLVALHHLDCPWKPAWIEQREGRILRQGNLCPEVTIFRYVMAGSFDVYRWQTVERKYSFIVAFNSPDLSMLSIEDPGLAVLSAREMTALATGNPKIIEQIEAQTRLRTLKAIQKEFEDTRWSGQSNQRRLQREQAEQEAKLERWQGLQAHVEANGGIKAAEALGRQLYDLCQPHFEVYDQEIEVGQLYSIPVRYKGHAEEIDAYAKQTQEVRTFWTGPAEGEAAAEPQKQIKITRRVHLDSDEYGLHTEFSLRIGETDRAENNANVLVNIFKESLPERIEEAQGELKHIARRLAELEKILAEPFSHADEIRELEAKLARLDLEIKAELGHDDAEERQAAQVDLDAPDDAEDADADEEDEIEFD